jgi:GNAT superfamily N-acetyltransferase
MDASELHLDHSRLSGDRLDEAALVALRAFYTDPFFVHLAPRPRQRNRGLFLFFRTAMAHLGPQGKIVTVRDGAERIVGVSAWIAPGGYPQPIATQLASVPGSLRALYRRPRSMIDGQSYLTAIAKAHPKEPHWYLYILAADPEAQRRGVGSMLLGDRIPEIDAAGVASYLETQKLDNIAYYRRFGYESTATLSPVAGGPPVYTMWRPAR